MARSLSKGVASIQVEIGGVAQAKQRLQELYQESEAFRKSLVSAEQTLQKEAAKKDTGGFDQKEFNKAKKAVTNAEKMVANTNRAIEDMSLKIQVVEGHLDNLSGNTMRKLIETQNILKATLKDLDPKGNFEEFKAIQGFIDEIGAAIKRLNGSSKEYTDYMHELDNVSDTTLSMIRKRLEDLVAGTDKNVQELDLYRKQLKEVAAEEERRKSSEAGAVMGNLGGSTVSEIQDAIKMTEQLRDAQTRGSSQWESYNTQIKQAQDYLKSFDERAEELIRNDKMSKLGEQSTSSLAELKKYWQAQVDGAKNASVEYAEYTKHLKAVTDEETRRASGRAGDVMGNLTGSSVKDIQDAIKFTEQLRDAQSRGSQAWATYNKQVEDAKNYLSSYDEAARRLSIDRQMQNLSTLSASGMSEVKKYWQEMVNGAQLGTQQLADYEAKLKQITDEETRRASGRAGAVMGNLTGSSIKEIQEAIKLTEGLRDAQSLGSQEWEKYSKQIENASAFLKSYDEAAKRLMMEDRMKNLTTLSNNAFEETKKFWKAQVDGAEQGSQELVDYTQKLEQILQVEKNRRDLATSTVMNNLSGSSVKEINDAIKATEELRDAQTRGSVQWKTYNQQIEDAKKHLKSFDERAEELIRNDKMSKLGEQSTSSLAELKKYWQAQVDGAKNASAEYAEYTKHLKAVTDEETRRASGRAGAVMGNLTGSSIKEIQEAIKLTEGLRDAQSLGSQEWEKYSKQIENASAFLKSYDEAAKRLMMEDRMKNLTTLSNNAFEETKKFWKAQVDGAEQGSQELVDYTQKLEQILQVEKNRRDLDTSTVMNNLSGSSVKEINDAIKATEELRDAQTRGSVQWKTYNQQIEDAKKHLKSFDEAAEKLVRDKKMADLGDQSKASLEELRKYWQAQVDGANMSNQSLDHYREQLRLVREEEQARANAAGAKVLGEVRGGTFQGTIAETKEAIKQLEEYKKQLKTSDTSAITKVDAALKELNDRIKSTAEDFYTLQRAQDAATAVQNNNFKGTAEDLERVRKKLLEYRQELVNEPDKNKFDENKKQIIAVEKQIEKLKGGVVDLDHVLDNIQSSSMEELKAAAAALQKELERSTHNTKEFITKSAKLREVNAEIKRINDQWKEHDGAIESVAKRLTAYVAVYGGFNFVKDRIAQMIQGNVELSDSLADIQKTTGLTTEAVAELSREIDGIDTRTSQAELHALAYEAGKLGIHAKEDVMGFVKAGNQLVAALGEDLGGGEAVRTLMKINDLLGETNNLGVEKALLATGSAINELTMRSTASAGPMVDIVSRLGAIGNQAGLTMADLIALGSTVDSLSLHAEMSGTALTKFIGSMQTNAHGIEYALQIEDGTIKRLMESGKAMEAVILILERMQGLDDEALHSVFGDLGSEGSRMVTVFSSLTKNVDTLRKHVSISNDAFREATSITNEYNIKNENLAALLQRLGNDLREVFINSGFVTALTEIVREFTEFVGWLKNTNGAVAVLSGTIMAFVGGGLAKLILALGRAKVAVQALWLVVRANPFVAVATAVSALAGVIISLATATTAAEEAQEDYNRKLEQEQLIMGALFNALKRENGEGERRKQLIEEINRRYSSYLGFMLSEKDSAEKIALAYEIVNARLKEQLALKMKNQMYENTTEKYSGDIQGALRGMRETLNESKGFGEALSNQTMDIIQDIVNDNLDKSAKDIAGLVSQELSKTTGPKGELWGNIAFMDIKENLYDFIEAQKTVQEEMQGIESYAASVLRDARKNEKKATMDMLRQITKEYNELSAQSTKDLSDEELKIRKEKLKDYAKAYIKNAEEISDSMSDEERKIVQMTVDMYHDAIAELDGQKNPIRELWGNNKQWLDMSAQDLVDYYKKVKKVFGEIRNNKSFDLKNAYGGRFNGKTTKEAQEEMWNEMVRTEKRLNEYYKVDLSLNPIDPNSKKAGGSNESETRKQYEAALSALEAYYRQRKFYIQQALIDEQLTYEEYNRQIKGLEEEKLFDFVDLRRKALGEENNFDASRYGDFFAGKDLDLLAKNLQSFGPGMVDGIKNELEGDLNELQQIAIDRLQKVFEIITKHDYLGKVDYKYQEQLEQLEIFWGKMEHINADGVRRVSQEQADIRMAALRKLSEDAEILTAEELENRMKKEAEFSEWVKKAEKKDYAVLLEMLRDYHASREEAENKHRQRNLRIANEKWEKSGENAKWDTAVKNKEDNAEMARNMQGLGLMSQSGVDDAEVQMYQLRLQAAQAYYNYILTTVPDVTAAQNEMALALEALTQAQISGDADAIKSAQERYNNAVKNFHNVVAASIDATKAQEEVNKAQLDLAEKNQEVTKNKLDVLKDYTDAVIDFSAQMGEAAFGEVEDRKEAGKQLLRTVMQITKDLIMEKVKALIMQKSLGKEENDMNQSTADKNTEILGQTLQAGLSATMGKVQGDVAAGLTSGASKTIGELGWWGIPLIAIISAALNALMGMAMGALNKSKSDVAAATGVSGKGRVAAGMLTYAEGDYPVLGNDGQIYNARYQKELKTGVYRGGAHFGIFSEKKPEMIVDGDTTQRLIVNYPGIYEAILTIAKNGRLRTVAPMQTYATGNLADLTQALGAAAQGSAAGAAPGNAELQATLASLTAATNALVARLNQPINASMDVYQANRDLKKSDSWMRKRGLSK